MRHITGTVHHHGQDRAGHPTWVACFHDEAIDEDPNLHKLMQRVRGSLAANYGEEVWLTLTVERDPFGDMADPEPETLDRDTAINELHDLLVKKQAT